MTQSPKPMVWPTWKGRAGSRCGGAAVGAKFDPDLLP